MQKHSFTFALKKIKLSISSVCIILMFRHYSIFWYVLSLSLYMRYITYTESFLFFIFWCNTHAHSIKQVLSYVKPSSPQTGARSFGHAQGTLLARITDKTDQQTAKRTVLHIMEHCKTKLTNRPPKGQFYT